MAKPDDILKDKQDYVISKDGTQARKGSVAAMMATVNAVDELLRQGKEQEIDKELEDIRLLIPALHSIGFFDFFHPLEWLQVCPVLREGKCWVALLYLQAHPEKRTKEIHKRLTEVAPLLSKSFQNAAAINSR